MLHSFRDRTMTQYKVTIRSGAIALVSAVALAFSSPDAGHAQSVPGANLQLTDAEQRQVEQTFDKLAMREMQRSPEWTSRLRLPGINANGNARSRLDDRSPAAFDRARIDWIEGLAELEALPASAKTDPEVRIALYAYQQLVDLAGYGYGHVELGLARPYAVDHMRGGWIDLIDLLGERHAINTPADLDSWLDRLELVSVKIDEDIRRLKFDAASGVVPPAPILDLIVISASPLANPDEATHPVLSLLDRQLEATGALDGGRKAQARATAARLVREEIVPAYERLLAEVETLRMTTGLGPGVWSLPDGADFYASLIQFYTSENLDADTLHQLGLEEVAQLQAELDVALVAAGLVEGSVGERLAILSGREDQVYSNDEGGRAALLADLRENMALIQAQAGAILPKDVRSPLAIVAVPKYLETSAPSAYYRAASIDGSRPGLLYINLRDTTEWPAYTLPTLVYHEGMPGHHAESAFPRQNRRVPLVNRLVWMSAYTEGWATYAEDLADEMGLYADDPLGRIGYLQSMLFRSARLVVDTGLHEKQWSREQAVDYLVATTGLPRSMMESEVDRYIVWPGQALTYQTGRNTIRRLRTQAEASLGEAFDLRAFHGVILENGPRPLSLVEADVYAWISDQTADRRAR